MLCNIFFSFNYLLLSQKSVPLQCVFHSIRFKVNKGWSKALLLFFILYGQYANVHEKYTFLHKEGSKSKSVLA